MFQVGQFDFSFLLFLCQTKKVFLAPSIFSSSFLFSSSSPPTLLPSPTIPSLLSQHPNPSLFFLPRCLRRLERVFVAAVFVKRLKITKKDI